MTGIWSAASDADYDVSSGNGDLWGPGEGEDDPRNEEGYLEEWDIWAAEVSLHPTDEELNEVFEVAA